ncbi:hypothetical protein Bca4012_062174 [Brassica carinata]
MMQVLKTLAIKKKMKRKSCPYLKDQKKFGHLVDPFSARQIRRCLKLRHCHSRNVSERRSSLPIVYR